MTLSLVAPGTSQTLRSVGRSRPLRPSWRVAIDTRLPDRAITLPEPGDHLDPRALYADGLDDVWLELGFGAGEHLLGRARAHPTIGFIGCEPYVNGLAALLARADAECLPRIRVFGGDARLLLPALAAASLGKVFMLFADPWPKRRHHRRRLLQTETLTEIARVLRPGGELLFASDHADYVRWTLALATDRLEFSWVAGRPGDWRDPPAGWIATRYQRKAEARGGRCYFLQFRRT